MLSMMAGAQVVHMFYRPLEVILSFFYVKLSPVYDFKYFQALPFGLF